MHTHVLCDDCFATQVDNAIDFIVNHVPHFPVSKGVVLNKTPYHKTIDGNLPLSEEVRACSNAVIREQKMVSSPSTVRIAVPLHRTPPGAQV